MKSRKIFKRCHTIVLAVGMMAVGTLAGGCSDSGNGDSCDSGIIREFSCGAKHDGTQQQACVDGQWFSTTLCKDANGNVVDGTGWNDEGCTDGATRAAVCGSKNQGLKPQVCTDGAWVDSNSCFLGPNGDGFHFQENPPGGNGGGGGNGGYANRENATSSADPDSCAPLASDDITGGVTLGPDTCYLVESGIGNNSGKLIIKDGVTMFFGSSGSVSISDDGRLDIEGTADNPVIMKGTLDERGFWGGLSFSNTANGVHTVSYLVVDGAGGKDNENHSERAGGIFVSRDAKAQLDHVTFVNNQVAGLNSESTSMTQVDNCIFDNNTSPIHIGVNLMGDLGTNLTFTDNDEAAIVVNNGASGTPNSSQDDATWRAYDIPYRFAAAAKIDDGDVVIQEGATLTFDKGTYLEAMGASSLRAIGTPDAPIVFTGVQEYAGSWRGVGFHSDNPDNELAFVEVRYAGGPGGWRSLKRSPGSVGIRDGYVSIHDSTISDSGADGIMLYDQSGENGVVADCSNMTFNNIAGDNYSEDGSATDASMCQ